MSALDSDLAAVSAAVSAANDQRDTLADDLRDTLDAVEMHAAMLLGLDMRRMRLLAVETNDPTEKDRRDNELVRVVRQIDRARAMGLGEIARKL